MHFQDWKNFKFSIWRIIQFQFYPKTVSEISRESQTLSKITNQPIFRNLQEVNMARNMLKTIASNIFEPAVRINKVSFIGNELTGLPDLGFRTAVELDLTNNTLSCDCGMTEFFAWVSEKGESTVTAECTAPEEFVSKGSCGHPRLGSFSRALNSLSPHQKRYFSIETR